MPNNNHPDDLGYLKMARVFYDGIIRAKNVITPPETPAGGIDDSSPPDVYGGNCNNTCPCPTASSPLRALWRLPVDPSNSNSGK